MVGIIETIDDENTWMMSSIELQIKSIYIHDDEGNGSRDDDNGLVEDVDGSLEDDNAADADDDDASCDKEFVGSPVDCG